MGMCVYYRKYINNYRAISLPLNKLTRTKEVFEWTEARITASDSLKEKLMKATSLALPDFTKPFILYMNASFVGLGEDLHKKQVINVK